MWPQRRFHLAGDGSLQLFPQPQGAIAQSVQRQVQLPGQFLAIIDAHGFVALVISQNQFAIFRRQLV
jgi:hypothetical protein